MSFDTENGAPVTAEFCAAQSFDRALSIDQAESMGLPGDTSPAAVTWRIALAVLTRSSSELLDPPGGGEGDPYQLLELIHDQITSEAERRQTEIDLLRSAEARLLVVMAKQLQRYGAGTDGTSAI